MAESRYFQVQQRDDVVVLHVQSIGLDRAAVNEFGQTLLEFVDQQRPLRLVVNLARVSELSSPTLGKLMLLEKRVAAYGGKMLVCEARGAVRELISLAWSAHASSEAEPIGEQDAVAQLKNWQG
jgi:anti-anti-sigma factor